MDSSVYSILATGFFQTLYMIFASAALGAMLGMPLGALVFASRQRHLFRNRTVYKLLSSVINVTRSLPFIILLVLLIPLTRWIVGTSIGTHAAVIPLGIGVAPFIARLVETSFSEVPNELIEVGLAMGATPFQIISRILWREAMPSLIRGMTLTLISLVGYSAMAGAIGGGGLGDIAIRYGYQRFDTRIMLLTSIVLIGLVQLIQFFGDLTAKRLDHRASSTWGQA